MGQAQALHDRIHANLEKVIRGKSESLHLLVVALLAGGNILMEDVPGVGKTTLAKALAQTVQGDFKRVQFTPDLLPTDIVGSSIYNPREGSFDFRRGPVFTNILLADEINRASPRTQSSLLEAMSERQVTIEGNCYRLPDPFLVLATQNPVEFHGTYPLPEAQLDRFSVKLELGYPAPDHELEMLEGQRTRHPLESLEPVAELSEVVAAQEEVRKVRVERPVAQYILALVQASRLEPRLKLGSSPRGAIALYRVSQALALCVGRDYVLPDDVKRLAAPVLAHRLCLDTKSKYGGTSKESIVTDLLEQVKVPT